jgi:hypothetical protein
MVEPGDPVPMQQRQPAVSVGLVQIGDQAAHQFARGAPEHVIAGQAVALAVPSTFDPVHRWHELQAFALEPVVDVASGMFDIVTRPRHGPVIGRIEFAETQPVAQGDFRCIRNFHRCLQRCADQRHAAEGPQCEPAQTLWGITIDQGDALACPQQFQCRNQAGEAATGDQNIGGDGYSGHDRRSNSSG